MKSCEISDGYVTFYFLLLSKVNRNLIKKEVKLNRSRETKVYSRAKKYILFEAILLL